MGQPAAGSLAPGLDWFALHLDDGHKLMIYHLRSETGDDVLRPALLDWEAGPSARENHPTPEHFQPLLVAMGAGGEARRLHHSVEHGVLAMDLYAFA